ncbi:hypothetical protein BG015_004926 [Linnemannia schmuckeri]|uniref:Uncharacterized protein n=1 Tax=Linnemannia schmuckeri TaxID=64567 RepID=A0A9P5VCU2_9FUNG|nr:hypothetical protein BG015_004926 [Linnemannia schmuckeri]
MVDSDHTTYYTNRCLRRLALLDSEEAHLLLNLKTPHISSTINHQRDTECLYSVRNTILEYELSLQSLYPLVPNKQDLVDHHHHAQEPNGAGSSSNGSGDGILEDNATPKKRRVTAVATTPTTPAPTAASVGATGTTGTTNQAGNRAMISPCDMSQRYKRKLNILDEEEQEFLGWGHKQDSPGLNACRQLMRKYETALLDFIQMQAEVGSIIAQNQH